MLDDLVRRGKIKSLLSYLSMTVGSGKIFCHRLCAADEVHNLAQRHQSLQPQRHKGTKLSHRPAPHPTSATPLPLKHLDQRQAQAPNTGGGDPRDIVSSRQSGPPDLSAVWNPLIPDQSKSFLHLTIELHNPCDVQSPHC